MNCLVMYVLIASCVCESSPIVPTVLVSGFMIFLLLKVECDCIHDTLEDGIFKLEDGKLTRIYGSNTDESFQNRSLCCSFLKMTNFGNLSILRKQGTKNRKRKNLDRNMKQKKGTGRRKKRNRVKNS